MGMDATLTTVETPLGLVEVARQGAGPPVLVIHGTPGGSDTSVAMGRFLVDAGFEVIAPSRPGYLGTPLDGCRSIDDQAKLHAALLSALGVERAGVLAWSGGGPSAYRLAVLYPHRVSALVAFAAVSQRYPQPRETLEERLLMQTHVGNWLLRFLAIHAPREIVTQTLKAEGDLSKAELADLVAGTFRDEGKRELVLTIADVVGDYAHRGAGVENDWACFGKIESLQLERVTVPTLVIHGSADRDVPPEHSDHAVATIAGAERLTMNRGTHLCLFVHPECGAAQARAIATLRRGPPRSSP
jgi:pimeloyl-ACP methyl ester carboxylesterase